MEVGLQVFTNEPLVVPAYVEYSGQRVLTTEQLAEFYEVEPRRITENFKRNEEHFVEGKHYFKVEGEALGEFRNQYANTLQISPKTRALMLWTKRGAARHCKILHIALAWEVYGFLEENYFSDDFFEKLRHLAQYVHENEKKCVYAFEMENGTIKIGYTGNIRQRMQTISSSSGLEIINGYATEFVDSEIAYQIEQACHETFDAYRTKGEFFRISFDEAYRELEKYAATIAEINNRHSDIRIEA